MQSTCTYSSRMWSLNPRTMSHTFAANLTRDGCPGWAKRFIFDSTAWTLAKFSTGFVAGRSRGRIFEAEVRDQKSAISERRWEAGSFPYRNLAHICGECSDPAEAQRLADWYRRIIANIERQMDEQGGFWFSGQRSGISGQIRNSNATSLR